ncbi:MAG: hypothetical protein COW54_14500 [Rhodobacteraceae bacterium CG17_big_fil_post_rev_8_21_14_2_50_63_15]|nr:MAG: hypothetical protein COW54_14500 [Rhodobacteraceae bacterium CG17_big_fil_post_rev_8_21_14_2_50_63_15]
MIWRRSIGPSLAVLRHSMRKFRPEINAGTGRGCACGRDARGHLPHRVRWVNLQKLANPVEF